MIQNVNKYPIDEILKKDASFYYVIPKYQREYTWSYKEWDALYYIPSILAVAHPFPSGSS